MSRTPLRATWTVACAFLLLVASTFAAQQFVPPAAADLSEIARYVVQMIEANHLSQGQVDDKVSEKLVAQWVKDLDSQKKYFLQADIDKISSYNTRLDDLLKAGNVDFALQSFDLYLNRLDERVEYAHKLIDMPQDFTVNETIENDFKSLAWAKSVEEINERWRKWVKYEFLTLMLDPSIKEEGKQEEIRKRLHRRYKTIHDSIHKTEKDEIFEMYLSALCNVFDPHSSYMSPRTKADFDIHMKLKLTGIGAVLRSEDGQTIVAEVVAGGAAAKDGRLKAGDKIVAVSGQNGEMIDIVEMKLTKVVDKVRGKEGTIVKLTVIPKDSPEPKIYELVRQVVEIKSQEVKGEIIETGSRLPGTAGKIGVIHVPSFYRDFQGFENGDADSKSTVTDMRAVLRDFKAKGGVDLVVVDLRNNPGGALAEAIEVSGLFIDKGSVVQVKDPRGRVKSLNDDEPGALCKEPLVVLINRHSASASEIFAGVIKDYGRGVVIGDTTTHGKGTVQSVMNVGPKFQFQTGPDRGALKLTIQQFYRPNGESTQKNGVPADVVLPSELDASDEGEAGIDGALPFDKVDSARYARLGMIDNQMIATLQDASHKRVVADAEFQKTAAWVKRFEERKQRKTVSLNFEELKKERLSNDPLNGEEEPPQRATDAPIFPVNSYNNEVLSLSLDYLKLIREAKTARK